MTHSVWVIASEQRFRTDSFSNHSMSIELDIELPLLTPFIFTPTHFQIFHPFPTHAFSRIFIRRPINIICPIVTSYYMTHIINAWWPTMSLLCSTCSTRPRKNCKKSTKNSKFQKKYSKKPKNPSKNFFSIFPKWHYFNFAISILVFVAIKMHLLKRYLCRYLYFIFIQKNCFNDVSLAVREFSLAIDFSSWWLTNQNWLSMILSSTWKIESHFFSNFTIFCEISNEKTHKAKVFLLNVWNSFANELLKCWNFAKLVFYILLSCQMSHAVLPRLDLTVWLTAVWLFDSHLNRNNRGKLM